MTTPESNEMATLPTAEPTGVPASTTNTAAEATSTSTSAAPPPQSSISQPTTTTSTSTSAPATTTTPAQDEDITAVATNTSAAPAIQRKESEAIGPAMEDGQARPEAEAGPTVLITLLLTTGKRHPYKIDAKYLRKRNVSVEDNDPWNLPVQTLKELILRDWREDWEEKPNSPSAIRLISMGLELQEGELLKEKRFNHSGPNIVHMVIKREMPEDEEIKKDSSRKGHNEEGRRNRSGCCGCVIQ